MEEYDPVPLDFEDAPSWLSAPVVRAAALVGVAFWTLLVWVLMS